jgi:GntP family gluconate:H+ symporter
MTAHDARLLLDATAGILLIVVLITAVRLHAFLALTIGSILVGLLAGHGATKTVLSFEAGVGGTLGYVGVIVALGTKLLADSGGADMIAQTVLRHSGIRRVPWAMALIAMVVGIPLFFEIGLVLLLPIIFTMARRLDAALADPGGQGAAVGTLQRSSTYLLVGIPALAGTLGPPRPGAAASRSSGSDP